MSRDGIGASAGACELSPSSFLLFGFGWAAVTQTFADERRAHAQGPSPTPLPSPRADCALPFVIAVSKRIRSTAASSAADSTPCARCARLPRPRPNPRSPPSPSLSPARPAPRRRRRARVRRACTRAITAGSSTSRPSARRNVSARARPSVGHARPNVLHWRLAGRRRRVGRRRRTGRRVGRRRGGRRERGAQRPVACPASRAARQQAPHSTRLARRPSRLAPAPNPSFTRRRPPPPARGVR